MAISEKAFYAKYDKHRYAVMGEARKVILSYEKLIAIHEQLEGGG